MTLVRDFKDAAEKYRGVIDPHDPLYGAVGDGQYGLDATITGGNTCVVTNYKLSDYYVGKNFWCAAIGVAPRTITAVNVGGDRKVFTFSGAAAPDSSNQGWMIGTDDTAALQKALDYARYSADSVFDVNGNWLSGGYVGDDATQNLRSYSIGRVVVLRSGRNYLVSNGSASYAGGKTAALWVSRRTGLVGPSFGKATIMTAPGLYGDIIANRNSRVLDGTGAATQAYFDFATIGGFKIYGSRGFGGIANAQDGLHLQTSFNGYLDTDPHIDLFDLFITQCAGTGLFARGRGEWLMHQIRTHECSLYGTHLQRLVDSSLQQSSMGGNSKTGLKVESCANLRVNDVKSWFSGKAGGTNEEDSANIHVVADQRLNGKTIFTAVEAQESRGSGIIIDNAGDMIWRSSRVQDAGQTANGLGTGTTPTIRAGVQVKNVGASQIDLDIRVEAAVRGFSTPNFQGSHALHIDGSAFGNFGRIETQQDLAYTGRSGIADGAKIGGIGVSNGSNTRIAVDGAALT